MGLFSGLGKYGLSKYEDAKVIEEKHDNKKNLNKLLAENTVQKTPEEIEKDALFDKNITCPVCDLRFSAKCIRAGKVKLSKKDTDLRPIYEKIDPLKYDVLTCDNCGYSALTRYFGKLAVRQIRDISSQIGENFSGIFHEGDLYTYDEAILRYKLALITTIVKKAKNSERGYTCLKYAWVLRGKRETLKADDPQYKELYDDEMESIKNAYECFKLAMENEQFPIAGMDEYTLKYVMADLARKIGKYDDCVRLIGSIITSKTAPDRLKERALFLKEMLKEDTKKAY